MWCPFQSTHLLRIPLISPWNRLSANRLLQHWLNNLCRLRRSWKRRRCLWKRNRKDHRHLTWPLSWNFRRIAKCLLTLTLTWTLMKSRLQQKCSRKWACQNQWQLCPRLLWKRWRSLKWANQKVNQNHHLKKNKSSKLYKDTRTRSH